MSRPKDFLAWAAQTFGIIAYHRGERVARFLEEAIELGQAEGLPADMIQRILKRVYARKPGNVIREIGQAQATLEMLAENLGTSADLEAEREFVRVRSIPASEWQARHRVKVLLDIALESNRGAVPESNRGRHGGLRC